MNTNRRNEPIIVSAVRTPIGKFLGSLSGIPAPRLGAIVIREALQRAGIYNAEIVDEVLMGNVVSAGLGQAPARQAAIFGGVPAVVPAVTVNKVCGSGMKTVMFACQAIRNEDGSIFVAGGMENMSRVPHLIDARTGAIRYGHAQLTDALLHDGLWDPFENWGMGEAAEFIADEFQISRQAMDDYALQSHQKAIRAIDQGRFIAEIVPIEIAGRKGEISLFSVDETPRRDTSIDGLGKLKPAFKLNGKVTAGNSPGLSDGAAALVVMSQQKAQDLGVPGLARIVGYSQAATEPKFLFNSPALVMPKLLEKVGWKLNQVDLIELNEAFAAQVLANGAAMESMGWDWEKANINGGSIALGHPIGASGARILTTLIHALRACRLQRGIAAMCLGGAEAVAIAVELIGE